MEGVKDAENANSGNKTICIYYQQPPNRGLGNTRSPLDHGMSPLFSLNMQRHLPRLYSNSGY